MMLVGVLVSAVSGGLTGLAVSLSQGNGLVHAVLSYPLGGILAMMTFALFSLTRTRGDLR